MVHYSAKIYAFYTCSTAYKKGLLISGHLLSKTYDFYTRSTVYKKQGGSIGMCFKFIILLIKFLKVF
jgi:hypothetical protein